MKPHTIYRIWIMLTALALITLACIIGTPVQPVATHVPQCPTTPISPNPGPTQVDQGQPTPNTSLADLMKATVHIYGCRNVDGELQPFYQGSGTIISSTGLILTNAHIASPAAQGRPEDEPDALAIGMMDKEDKPAVFMYLAKVIAVDGTMDLAVIQISTTLDGAAVDTNSLNLPFVQLGNSDVLNLGNHLNIFGFPGIGGDTITFTAGVVSGFTGQKDLGDRAWIKTDTMIAGGNSGGLAANDAGLIVGVPTEVGAGGDTKVTDCRKLADTNGDGVVDEKDTCIPTGGFINALRSINLALPLIDAAQSGKTYVSPFGEAQPPSPQPSPQPSPSDGESFGAVTWYTVTLTGSDCKIKDQVNAFPSGTTAMAALWSFTGMTDGEPWAEEWTLNGKVAYSGQESWDRGVEGKMFSCLTSSKGFTDGTYHIKLFAGQNNTLLTESDVVVGGGPNPAPAPGPSNQGVVTLFGKIYDADSNNPLPGTQVFILNPGTTYAQWEAGGFLVADVFTRAKADEQGNYSLPDKLALDVGYTLVVDLEGYPRLYGDDRVWTSQDPVNYQLDIPMSK